MPTSIHSTKRGRNRESYSDNSFQQIMYMMMMQQHSDKKVWKNEHSDEDVDVDSDADEDADVEQRCWE